jgi:starvation-inducible DNA-binding protein
MKGIDMADTVQNLNSLIADFTVLYQKLRHYHWNVTGSRFFQLHEKFEEMYTGVGGTIDELAERVVGLEGTPLHTLAHVLETASLSEDASTPADAEMVGRTIADFETLSEQMLGMIASAEKEDDRTTVNLLDEIRDGLAGHLWMLKAWSKE